MRNALVVVLAMTPQRYGVFEGGMQLQLTVTYAQGLAVVWALCYYKYHGIRMYIEFRATVRHPSTRMCMYANYETALLS